MSFISDLFHVTTMPSGPSISIPLNPLDNPANRVAKYVGKQAGTWVREHPQEIRHAVNTATSNAAHNMGTLAKVGAVLVNPLTLFAFRF